MMIIDFSRPLSRKVVEEQIVYLADPELWNEPELRRAFMQTLVEHPVRYKEFMDHFRALVLEMERDETWEQVASQMWAYFDGPGPFDAIYEFRHRWEFATSFYDHEPWFITEYKGERLERRTAAWKEWRESDEAKARQMSPEQIARVRALMAEVFRPKSYYERLYEGVEYDPYTGELVSVPEGSIELDDGSWLIPDVDPDPPEEAFGKNGERLEPYSKEWNAYMRDKYFNWPLDHDESGPTCSLAFQR